MAPGGRRRAWRLRWARSPETGRSGGRSATPASWPRVAAGRAARRASARPHFAAASADESLDDALGTDAAGRLDEHDVARAHVGRRDTPGIFDVHGAGPRDAA